MNGKVLSTRPLIALLLSDGKAGHYTQAEGVIAAIGRVRPVETVRMEVRRRLLVPTRVLHHFVNTGASPALILRMGYGLAPGNLPDADVVVSAGGETIAANVAAAKLAGIPNIFCGRLRRAAPEHVRLVIVSLERFGGLPNHLICLPPSPIGAMAGRPADGSRRLGPDNPPARVGVLVGGNSGALRYGQEDWAHLIRFMREAHASHGMRWLATTSRRSGPAISDALAAAAQDSANGIDLYIDYRSAGPGTLQKVFTSAEGIIVTDDSTTMISEAVGARLPVVAVAPAAMAQERREVEYRAFLARNDWYRRLPLAELTPAAFLAALSEIAPRETSALDELAAALRQRLPELFAKP